MNEKLMAYHCIAEVLDELGVQGLGGPDAEFVQVTAQGEQGVYYVSFSVLDHPARVRVWTTFPVVVPEPRRSAVAELMARLNYMFVIGSYVLDMDDGVLRFTVPIPIFDAPALTAQIRLTLKATMATIDDTFRTFFRLLFDRELSPAEAAGELVLSELDKDPNDDCGM